MLYSETDRAQVSAERARRLWIVVAPAVLLLLLSVGSFVWYRLRHDTDGWIWTALLTLAGGAYFIFMQGVYLRPISLYKRHVEFMLGNRKRETVGVLKEIGRDVLDKDGLDCRTVTVNVGDKDAPEDDRSFYLDAFKTPPEFTAGARVRVLSNDRMVAGIELAD
jgi:hypothetical protein